MLEDNIRKTEPEYYPPVENLLDLIYEHYTENNPVEKNTVAGKVAKEKEKELEEWLRGLVEWIDRSEIRFLSGRRSWTGRGRCAVHGRRLLLRKV